MKTVAIFSPNQNAYSETFIQAHKKLPFNIKFYYGGTLPSALDGSENILKLSFSERVKRKFLKEFTFEQKRLLFSLRHEKVDCVLAEYGVTAADSLKIIKYLNLPLIVHFHGFDSSNYSVIREYENQYQEVFQYAKGIIVVSKKMQSDIERLGCPPNKLIFAPYGPSTDFYSVKNNYQSSQFISVGRFVEKKAPHLTIIAFKKVIEVDSGATLVMVGDGPLLHFCKQLADAMDLSGIVIFKGIQSQQEIKDLMSSSVAFVQHSITAENGDSEGTPVAILEAGAAGLPVISTLHAGIPDVVMHQKTGLLVEELDVEGMSKNMIQILQEKDLAEQLGRAARKHVQINFPIEKHLQSLTSAVEMATA